MPEPVTVAEAAAHLRIASDDPYYSSLSDYITAARATVEQYLNATIVNRTRTLTLDAFPSGSKSIALPNGPVTGITSIAYVDDDGANQTVASYRLVNEPLRDRLSPAYGESWPATQNIQGAVTITYTAGMLDGSPLALADERRDIWAGILLTLGDLWANREGAFIGISHTVNPTVERLLHFMRRDLGI